MDPITFLLLFFLLVILIVALVVLYWFGGMLIPLINRGAPYVATEPAKVKRMIKLAKIKETDHVVDLGSGDGRLLVAAIKAGAKSAVGYEVHPGLVRLSRRHIKKLGLEDKIEIKKKSFWKADLSDVDVILLYQIPFSMKGIEKKVMQELKEGGRIISNAFKFPDWEPEQDLGDVVTYKK